MTQQQIRVRTQDGIVSERKVPIPNLLVSATTSGTAQTLYTVRPGVLFMLSHLAVVNTDVGNAKLELHSVSSGDSIADSNTELALETITSNTAVNLTDIIGQLYEAETVFKVWSDTANALVVHGWGTEIL